MNLSELEGKEIINMYDGGRLGMVAETELVFNSRTGKLESIVIPNQGGFLSLFSQEQYLIIPWESVVKVGAEVIIVDLKTENYELLQTQLEY